LGFNGYDEKQAKWDKIIAGFALSIETECDPAIVIKVRLSLIMDIELELFNPSLAQELCLL